MASARARSRGNGDSAASTAFDAPHHKSSTGRAIALVFGTAIAVLAFAGFLARSSPATTAELLQLPVLDASNIGNVRAADYMAYGPIDVVYTWVNGTDPRWKAEKEYWHKHWIASLTGQPLPEKPEDTHRVKGSDTANADNRFRDNEELRYSLRSLEKYAPWVRHIYVVTDGQVPSWLNLASPKLRIVKHSEIFANQSHLPVFSSPAIEWSLDNIPGLSDAFLYFNDDVFLGSHVRPEDFVSQTGVQKVYFAWEAPLCSPGCWDTALQNGRCDRECNVTACDFDMGDCGCDVDPIDGRVTCDPVKIASIKENEPKVPKVPEYLCQGSCHYKWLGDGGCDLACNISACGYDAGDCGTDVFQDLHSADIVANQTLVQVPLSVNATYLNVSGVFGPNGSVVSAEHDNEALVRHATVFEHEMLLLLVFGRDEDGDPLTSSAVVTVSGRDVNGSAIRLDVAVVRGKEMVASASDGGFFTFQNTSIRPRSVRLPFGLRQAEMLDRKDVDDSDGDDNTLAADDSSSAEDTHASDDAEATGVVTESDFLQALDVILPFNLTGKHLREGDVLDLGYDVSLRLHDDVEDFDWSEFQLCRVRIPETTTPTTTKTDDTENKATDVDTASSSPSSSSSSSSGDAMETDVSVGDSDPATASSKANDDSPKTFAFDVLEYVRETEGPGAVQSSDDEADAATDSTATIPLCRIVENGRAIALTFKIPTFASRAAAGATSEVVSESVADDTPTPIAANGDATVSTTTTSAGATTTVTTTTVTTTEVAVDTDAPSRPQVVDGAICFFNNDLGHDAKRYCFALALGHFHPQRQVVVHKPTLLAQRTRVKSPRPAVVYEPYRGAHDDALIELGDVCIDTTLRSAGVLPRVCDLLEVPSILPSESDHDVVVDAALTENELEGRRLACEAKRRRLAQRDARVLADAAAHAASGQLGTAKRWVADKLARVQATLGLNTVDVASDSVDDIDDVEYEDVCAPLLHGNTPTPAPEISQENADALLSKDTFGDSLRFVNKLYNRAFGKASSRRRVPAHMPFLFKKQIIREIKARWPREVDATSTHRFRHPQDMQFSFSYFHYVLNRHKVVHMTLLEIWHAYLDVNRNGILDENELLTAASLAYGDYPPDAYVTEVRTCLQPPKQERVREQSSGRGTVRLTETLTPHITFEHVAKCTDVAEKLVANVRREKQFELMGESEVTFHMLSENYRFAWNQMLGTRARRTKFVCINDDMKYPSSAVSQILHELFLSIWPKRSQFELPYHLTNRYAHIDEYNNAHTRRTRVAMGLGVLVLLVALYFRRALWSLFGFHDIARARAASASKLSADLQREHDAQDASDNGAMRD